LGGSARVTHPRRWVGPGQVGKGWPCTWACEWTECMSTRSPIWSTGRDRVSPRSWPLAAFRAADRDARRRSL